MAFFSRPEEPHSQGGGRPEPISRDRLEAVLKARDYRYFIDSEGDIGGSWDGHLFYFFFYGEHQEILQVRGRWNRELPLELRPQVLDAIDQWHQDKIWPKVYTRVSDANISSRSAAGPCMPGTSGTRPVALAMQAISTMVLDPSTNSTSMRGFMFRRWASSR